MTPREIFDPRDGLEPKEKADSPFNDSDLPQAQFDVPELPIFSHIYRSIEQVADKLRYAISPVDEKSKQIEEATMEGVRKRLRCLKKSWKMI